MKNLITTQSLEPDVKTSLSNYSGILNSNYKTIVKQNFKSYKSSSIFSRKQRLKVWRYNSFSSVDTILKVSLFFIVAIMAVV